MKEIITNSLKNVGSEFRSNELAYLALTTKIELPFRDRWAFALHRELPDNFIVSREWNRTDIAIIDDDIPKALIELKAMYTFDAAILQKNVDAYCEAMERDEIKARKVAKESTEIYTIMLMTHPRSEVPIRYQKVIKYIPGINKAIRKFSKASLVAKAATNAIDKKLSCKNVIAKGSVIGGKAFGIETDVLYWLIKY